VNLGKLSIFSRLGSAHRLALGIATAAIFAIAMGVSSPAHAQYGRRYYGGPPGYYPTAYRSGVVAGLGVGVGALNADACGSDCGGGLSLEGHLGGMIDPRMALMFDAWAIFHSNPEFNSTTTSGIYTGALQFWLAPIVWLKGGLGVGNTHIDEPGVRLGSATAFAMMGAAGVELVHTGFFALDLQGRVGHTFFSNADGGPVTDVAFMVGVNWY
jgi:hypothetical protein